MHFQRIISIPQQLLLVDPTTPLLFHSMIIYSRPNSPQQSEPAAEKSHDDYYDFAMQG